MGHTHPMSMNLENQPELYLLNEWVYPAECQPGKQGTVILGTRTLGLKTRAGNQHKIQTQKEKSGESFTTVASLTHSPPGIATGILYTIDTKTSVINAPPTSPAHAQ